MNRNDRNAASAAIRKYCCTVLQSSYELSSSAEKLREKEETKQASLPESLKTSSQAGNIEESIAKLKEIEQYISEIEELCVKIDSVFHTEIDFQPKDTQPYMIEDSHRRNRFQILLPDDLFILMKLRSLSMGISCNELICQSLRSELLKDPFV
jgi:hypothetical protein